MSERKELHLKDDQDFERRLTEWKEMLIKFAKSVKNLNEDELIKSLAIKLGIRVEILPMIRDFNAGNISEDELVVKAVKLISANRGNQ